VLVIDRDDGVRDVCASMLHTLGYRALTRAQPDDLALSAARSVDIVLIDVESRVDASTRSWIADLKRLRPGVRVLVMSGHPARDLAVFVPVCADGVLYKPFRLAELDAHLDHRPHD
jgi:DNA-binding NtrC family response regulator